MSDIGRGRIRDIFLRTCDRPREEQQALLDSLCGDDAALREEIDSLLRHDRELAATGRRGSLEQNVFARLESALSALKTVTSSGDRSAPLRTAVGKYLLVEKIGEGGMGMVFRAEDTVLHRTVALKFLAGPVLEREGARRRFLREARLAAGLNHPNICTVHEVGEAPEVPSTPVVPGLPAPGSPYMATELIEGDTLTREMKRRGRLPVDILLDVASQAADGLAAAHARGIVHRDLKPGNIMLTPDGRVKLLDFGLAKALQPAEMDRESEPDSDISEELTRQGMVLGTTPYMSPEQARGEPLDIRSDIFSFGILLYEMLAGHRPFRGSTAETTRLRIIESDPEPLPREVSGAPRELEVVILRCLRKRPEERFGSGRELSEAIRHLVSQRNRQPRSLTRFRSSASRLRPLWTRTSLLAALAGSALAVAAVAILLNSGIETNSKQRTPPPPVHAQITFTGTAGRPDISPDGKSIAYVDTAIEGENRLMIQDIGGEKPIEIHRQRVIRAVEWSPDGLEILFTTWESPEQTPAYIIPRYGGTPKIVPFPGIPVFVTWSPEGTALAASSFPPKDIWIHDVTTGETRTVPIIFPFEAVNGLDRSPRGDRLLVLTRAGGSRSEIWSIQTDGQGANRVLGSTRLIQRALWAPDGKSVYYALPDRNTKVLWKVAIDPSTGKSVAPPLQLMSGWQTDNKWSFSNDARRLVSAHVSMSANLFVAEASHDGPDARVENRQVTTGTQVYMHASLSPDGSQVAMVRGTGLNGFGKLELADIVIMPLSGGLERQITFSEYPKSSPAWSPDGKRIAYMAEHEGGAWRISIIDARGGVPHILKNAEPDFQKPLIWAPADSILYWHSSQTTPTVEGLRTIDPSGGNPHPVLQEAWETVAWSFVFSPDGTQVVFSHRNRGTIFGLSSEIRVASLSDEAERILAQEPGLVPLKWSADGSHIYSMFEQQEDTEIQEPSRIRRIAVDTGAISLGWKVPESLIDSDIAGAQLSAEGTVFLNSLAGESVSDIWLVENFDPTVQ